MSGIKNLKVDTNKYAGEISITSKNPEIHVILSADTLFLDCAMEAMLSHSDVFEIHTSGRRDREGVYFMKKTDMLVDGLTVAENLFLKLRRNVFLSKNKMFRECDELFERIGFYLPVNAMVSDLTVSQRRFVEFYRALLHEPDILVASEVTTHLSYKEISYYKHILNELKEKGTTIFFLTTRVEEAVKVGGIIHLYVNGELRREILAKDVFDDPQELYSLLLDIEPNQLESKEQREQQHWMKVIAASMRIEDQIARISTVFGAYCNRIRNLLAGEFCRLYLYQVSNEQLLYLSGDLDVQSGYGQIKDIRAIADTSTLFVSNEKERGYREIFESDNYPKSLVCYTLKNDANYWVFIEVGINSLEYCIKSSKVDLLQFIAIELLIFIDNNRLRNQTVLLQESNHRIKNNMQMILSYLLLQRQSLQQKLQQDEDRETIDGAFQDLNDRIMAVFNVHNMLSSEEYLQDAVDLTELLREVHRIYSDYIELETQIERISFPRKLLLSLCIIFNEMMNNTVKHNKGIGRKLKVEIRILQDATSVYIIYQDDGDSEEKRQEAISTGIGMRLISVTVQNELKGTLTAEPNLEYQLKGNLTVETRTGYKVSIVFPKSSLAKK